MHETLFFNLNFIFSITVYPPDALFHFHSPSPAVTVLLSLLCFTEKQTGESEDDHDEEDDGINDA